MVRGQLRNNTFKRIKRRMASGVRTIFRKPRPSVQKCGATGERLQGIPRYTTHEIKSAPKTHKRPERPYGGALSSKAARSKIKSNARSLEL